MFFLLYFFYVLPRHLVVSAHPIFEARSNNGSINSNSPSGWVNTPHVRGTFDLLMSCLTTLSLCAWTAYHPNVLPKTSDIRNFGRRIMWMTIAIFVPEVVLFCAWEQWWTSRQLRKEVNELGSVAFNGSGAKLNDHDHKQCLACPKVENTPGEDASGFEAESTGEQVSVRQSVENGNDELPLGVNESSNPQGDESSNWSAQGGDEPNQAKNEKQKSPKQWTMEQAFFALCGGFAVDSSSFSHRPTLTFTPAGIRFLAKLGILPQESPEAVTDKSKADTFAKVLVCIQAGWFFVQSIARLAQKLPLSLLELHVLMHVLCAFCMYFLWFDKPYNVGNPIICTNEKVVDMAALFALEDQTASRYKFPGDEWKCSQMSTIGLSEVEGTTKNPVHRSSIVTYIKRFWYAKFPDFKKDPETPRHTTPPPSRISAGTRQALEHQTRANRALALLKSKGHHFQWLDKAERYDVLVPDSDPADPDYETHYHRSVAVRLPIDYVVAARSNLRIDGMSYRDADDAGNADRGRLHGIQIKTFAAMSAVYGGLHVAAWPFHFPSVVEMWMWRAAGLAMAGAPVLTLVFIAISNVGEMVAPGTATRYRGWALVRRVVSDVVFTSPAAVLGVVTVVLWGLYPAARLFVLVESFASLRSSPVGTYDMVAWTGFIPHGG